MFAIGLEWWILYAIMLVGLFFVWGILVIIRACNARLEGLFKGLDIIHRDMEEIKRILLKIE